MTSASSAATEPARAVHRTRAGEMMFIGISLFELPELFPREAFGQRQVSAAAPDDRLALGAQDEAEKPGDFRIEGLPRRGGQIDVNAARERIRTVFKCFTSRRDVRATVACG